MRFKLKTPFQPEGEEISKTNFKKMLNALKQI